MHARVRHYSPCISRLHIVRYSLTGAFAFHDYNACSRSHTYVHMYGYCAFSFHQHSAHRSIFLLATFDWQQLLHVCTLCTILVVSYCAKYKLVCQHERYHSTCTCTCLHRSFNLIQFHQDCWQNNRVLFFFLFRPGRPVASSTLALLLRLRWATARIGPTVIANSRTKFWKK